MKNDLILLIIIMISVFLAAIVGFIIGSLPIQEKYKIYYENSVTYIERVK